MFVYIFIIEVIAIAIDYVQIFWVSIPGKGHPSRQSHWLDFLPWLRVRPLWRGRRRPGAYHIGPQWSPQWCTGFWCPASPTCQRAWSNTGRSAIKLRGGWHWWGPGPVDPRTKLVAFGSEQPSIRSGVQTCCQWMVLLISDSYIALTILLYSEVGSNFRFWLHNHFINVLWCSEWWIFFCC